MFKHNKTLSSKYDNMLSNRNTYDRQFVLKVHCNITNMNSCWIFLQYALADFAGAHSTVRKSLENFQFCPWKVLKAESCTNPDCTLRTINPLVNPPVATMTRRFIKILGPPNQSGPRYFAPSAPPLLTGFGFKTIQEKVLQLILWYTVYRFYGHQKWSLIMQYKVHFRGPLVL